MGKKLVPTPAELNEGRRYINKAIAIQRAHGRPTRPTRLQIEQAVHDAACVLAAHRDCKARPKPKKRKREEGV